MNYWIYENWTVVKSGRTTIHAANCPYCNDGQGMNKTKDPNRNGKWHGPFDSYKQAQNHAKGKRSIVRDCGRCINK